MQTEFVNSEVGEAAKPMLIAVAGDIEESADEQVDIAVSSPAELPDAVLTPSLPARLVIRHMDLPTGSTPER